MRRHHRYLRICVGLLGAALAAAGCSSSGGDTPTSKGGHHSPSGTASASTSASPGSGSVPPRSAAPAHRPGAPSHGADADVRCHTGELTVTSHPLGAAAGNHYAELRFTNVSGSSCRVYGFPGMQLLGSSGGDVPTKVVRDPTSKPKLVTLKPNATATSRVSWAAIPGSGESGAQCEPTPARAEVTPPDETAHKIISWTYGPACQHGRMIVTALK